MNWYKQIKIAVNGLKPNYLHIGHDEHGVMWAINDKWEFFAKSVRNEYETHMSLGFPGPWIASGRYDPNRHMASLGIEPEDFPSLIHRRSIIERIISILNRKLNHPEIFVYED